MGYARGVQTAITVTLVVAGFSACAPRFYASGSSSDTEGCPGYTVGAADFIVDSSGDAGDAATNGICATAGSVCTLRAAIAEANAMAGTQVIRIPAGLTVNVTGVINITDNVQIVGMSRTTSIVSGGGTSRIFSTGTASGTAVEIDNMTVQNAVAASSGPGLYALGGDIVLRYVIFQNNSATGGNDGGAITVDNSFGTLNPTLTIDCSTFTSNTSVAEGGAINSGVRTLLISNSEFASNRTTTGAGGAINIGSGAASVSHTIRRVLFNANRAVLGGAVSIQASGPVINARVESSTFFANQADTGTAGIYTDNSVTTEAYNNTFLNNINSGGFADLIQVNTGGDFSAANSIFWNNTGPSNMCNIAGTFTSLGTNIYDDMSNCTMVGTDLTTDPGLGALADNGGFTHTVTFAAGGSADSAANSAYCPSTDQRSYTRGTPCDIGAYERR